MADVFEITRTDFDSLVQRMRDNYDDPSKYDSVFLGEPDFSSEYFVVGIVARFGYVSALYVRETSYQDDLDSLSRYVDWENGHCLADDSCKCRAEYEIWHVVDDPLPVDEDAEIEGGQIPDGWADGSDLGDDCDDNEESLRRFEDLLEWRETMESFYQFSRAGALDLDSLRPSVFYEVYDISRAGYQSLVMGAGDWVDHGGLCYAVDGLSSRDSYVLVESRVRFGEVLSLFTVIDSYPDLSSACMDFLSREECNYWRIRGGCRFCVCYEIWHIRERELCDEWAYSVKVYDRWHHVQRFGDRLLNLVAKSLTPEFLGDDVSVSGCGGSLGFSNLDLLMLFDRAYREGGYSLSFFEQYFGVVVER